MRSVKETVLTILANILALLITFTCIFPLIWLLYNSVKDKYQFMKDTISLPTNPQWGNYAKAIKLGNLIPATFNTLFNVVITVVLVSVASVIVAYFLARYNFKGKKVVSAIFLIGMLIPLYALLVPMFLQYKMLGMTNTRFVLILPYFAMQVPLGIFLCESFIQDIPREIEEAAVIDGCGLSQIIFKIIFPLSKPMISTVAILTLLASWNEFAFATVLSSDSKFRTLSVAIQSYSSGREMEYTLFLAALVMVSIPIILIYFIFSKQIINGMTAGAVKG